MVGSPWRSPSSIVYFRERKENEKKRESGRLNGKKKMNGESFEIIFDLNIEGGDGGHNFSYNGHIFCNVPRGPIAI